MKKLTAGIFTVLMGLVSVNAADAAVASKGYVDQVAKNTTTAYQAADSALETKITNAYQAADSALQSAIDSKVAQTEYNDKIQELEADIGALSGTGENSVSGLISASEQKITKAYQDADTALQSNINTLSDTVTANKSAADATQSALTTETNARIAADSALQSAIDGMDLAAAAEEGKYVSTVAQQDGTVSQTLVAFSDSVTKNDKNAPSAGAVANFVESSLATLENGLTSSKQDLLFSEGEGANVLQSGTGVVKTVAAEDGTLTATASLVATADIDDNAVTTAKIADSNVTTAKIADSAVTTAKIADNNVTDAKIVSVSMSKVTGLEDALGAKIPAPSGACANPQNKCTLVFKGGENVQANYEWEVIERGTEGEYAGL